MVDDVCEVPDVLWARVGPMTPALSFWEEAYAQQWGHI